jgi:hypothetical protein
MFPRIPWELFVNPLGSVEHTLGTTGLDNFRDSFNVAVSLPIRYLAARALTHRCGFDSTFQERLQHR